MKEKQKRDSSFGRLTLVKSPAKDEIKKIKSPIKKTTESELHSQWVNYHYSYAEFIHSYVEHINTLRRLNDNRKSSKVLRLFKLMQ